MTREQKLEAIYAEMANKEDSFGLRFIAKFQDYKDKYFDARELTTLFGREDEDGEVFREAITDGGLLKNHYYLDEDAGYIPHIKRGEVLKIIGHPVMIGDVLDWIEPYGSGHVQSVEFTERRRRKMNLVLLQRDNKRLPIDEQSDGCIDYVYSLIQKD